MVPVHQRIVASGGDERLPGDCVKCCIASIFELAYEDVPHFVAREVKDATGKALWWFEGVNYWLRERGYPLRLHHWTNNLTAAEVFKRREDLGLEPGQSMPALDMYRVSPHPDRHDGWWIASVISENFEQSTHAIVMCDGEVAFDPSTKPRRTPYQFIGGSIFVATDPARCRP